MTREHLLARLVIVALSDDGPAAVSASEQARDLAATILAGAQILPFPVNPRQPDQPGTA